MKTVMCKNMGSAGPCTVPAEIVGLGLVETMWDDDLRRRVFAASLDKRGPMELWVSGDGAEIGFYDDCYICTERFGSAEAAVSRLGELKALSEGTASRLREAFGEALPEAGCIRHHFFYGDVCGDGRLDMHVGCFADFSGFKVMFWKTDGPLMRMGDVVSYEDVDSLVSEIGRYLADLSDATALLDEVFGQST